MKNLKIALTLLMIVALQTGCASFNKKLKSLVGGNSSARAETPGKKELVTYSESPSLSPNVKRKYKRTTRESLENEAMLNEKAGSLWVMEGQGAYLFSQNIMRMMGDPIAVQLDGDPKDQLVAKVDVIKGLIKKIEDRQKLRMRGPANAGAAPGTEGGEAKPEEKKEAAADEAADDAEFKVKNVPTRIVERMVDGNYRVKGSQPFLIKGREYKIIVTGVVRAEDFNDAGISATKLLDPKFDIVSAKRSETM